MATDTPARTSSDFDTLAKLAVTDLVERLSTVPDPRGSQGVLHRFTDILAIITLASPRRFGEPVSHRSRFSSLSAKPAS